MLHATADIISPRAGYIARTGRGRDANYYQSVIGICAGPLNSVVLISTTEVSMLSPVLPHDGHLVGALLSFTYLEKKHNARMVFDPTYPVVDAIPTHDWKDFL
jgi:hypothetical protein